MPAVTQILPGANAGIYENTGTYGTPVWTEQTSVKDVKPQYPWDFADTQSRATPIKLYAKTLIDLPVQVVMRADPADAEYAAWILAHWSRTAVMELLIINSKITTLGAAGTRGEYVVSMSEEPQEIDGTIYATFELRPTLTANGYPKYAVIATGPTPAFTAITY